MLREAGQIFEQLQGKVRLTATAFAVDDPRAAQFRLAEGLEPLARKVGNIEFRVKDISIAYRLCHLNVVYLVVERCLIA